MNPNTVYQDIIRYVHCRGDLVDARNALTKSLVDVPPVIFTSTPLVTYRATAWGMALREWEWFMSGDPHCPPELEKWWSGQLNPIGDYLYGYGAQLRTWNTWFDQIEFLIDGLDHHPTSRRHLLTTWNASDMASITEINENKKTPTTCHTTIAQFFVRNSFLYMTSYQRSADLLLGVPHNWIQSWAFLLWLACQVNLRPGSMRWIFGDAHIYQEESHLKAVDEILRCNQTDIIPVLTYNGSPGTEFHTTDFKMVGEIPKPRVTTRPKLL